MDKEFERTARRVELIFGTVALFTGCVMVGILAGIGLLVWAAVAFLVGR